ncbi:FHA domain-containing protein [Oculatella sp. LEGE 06141]|uniref:FHA domain-containing protein n=1 Tax=Oculatella sp. LEGE 06141 TaxID=1828648 RepID=UPI00188148C8|nr:FHA domain-containing protein [Oculatella sp. LEGE 06141]MBE9178426.1 FHA domain-containing protein [Oculatella sp. LEGE 06141]
MIVCPNCTHQNPDGAIQCEACYTPLPAMTTCPNCGSAIQTDASFCGQCGFNLRTAAAADEEAATSTAQTASPDFDIPDLSLPEPLVAPDPLLENLPPPPPVGTEAIAANSEPMLSEPPPPPPPPPPTQQSPVVPQPVVAAPAASAPASGGDYHTQLQTITARLLHVQTSRPIELPQNLSVVHIGKPNDRVPPDIDVSGFPNSEIVSRIHADIRLEGDSYYLEDVGSSNGTYINNLPLPVGNRHRLRPGDRIALGKGDKMTFLFQLA